MKEETRGRKYKNLIREKIRVCITMDPCVHLDSKVIAANKKISLSNMIEKILIDLKINL